MLKAKFKIGDWVSVFHGMDRYVGNVESIERGFLWVRHKGFEVEVVEPFSPKQCRVFKRRKVIK